MSGVNDHATNEGGAGGDVAPSEGSISKSGAASHFAIVWRHRYAISAGLSFLVMIGVFLFKRGGDNAPTLAMAKQTKDEKAKQEKAAKDKVGDASTPEHGSDAPPKPIGTETASNQSASEENAKKPTSADSGATGSDSAKPNSETGSKIESAANSVAASSSPPPSDKAVENESKPQLTTAQAKPTPDENSPVVINDQTSSQETNQNKLEAL